MGSCCFLFKTICVRKRWIRSWSLSRILEMPEFSGLCYLSFYCFQRKPDVRGFCPCWRCLVLCVWQISCWKIMWRVFALTKSCRDCNAWSRHKKTGPSRPDMHPHPSRQRWWSIKAVIAESGCRRWFLRLRYHYRDCMLECIIRVMWLWEWSLERWLRWYCFGSLGRRNIRRGHVDIAKKVYLLYWLKFNMWKQNQRKFPHSLDVHYLRFTAVSSRTFPAPIKAGRLPLAQNLVKLSRSLNRSLRKLSLILLFQFYIE